MLRRDGEFGLCECGSKSALELGQQCSGAGEKKLGELFP